MTKLQIRELHPAFGVEIAGLEPRIPLDDRTVQQLRSLFDDKGLLVIRGIDADQDFQVYLSHLLIGDESPSADVASAKGPAQASAKQPVSQREWFVSNKAEGGAAPFGRILFHCDNMWSSDVFQLISLYGEEVEEPSTPTIFVSAVHAWKTLPDALRERVKDRFAVHGQDATFRLAADEDGDVLVSTFERQETIRLPVGHTHPRTGRKLLYVAQQMTHRIDDIPPGESDALLDELYDHLYAPENVVEHKWHKGDLVLWDNIALQHARPNVSVEGPARTLRKVFAPSPDASWFEPPKFSKVAD